jgi:CHASE2 domain-containing sensor protein
MSNITNNNTPNINSLSKSDYSIEVQSGDYSNILSLAFDTNNMYSPLIVFIIICFFCLVGVIIYKSVTDRIPSVCTMGVQTVFMFVGCAILIVMGVISINIEWLCLLLLTLAVFLSIYVIIEPEVLLYSIDT